MKTPEEIKLAMEMCTSAVCTNENGCPYGELVRCADVMTEDGLAYIKQLESNASQVSKALCDKENATLEEMLEAVSQLKQKTQQPFAAAERKGGPMKNAMKFAKMLINWMIWFMGIDLIVRLGWTYNDPVPAGMVWIGLVGLKCALEAMTGWTK